MSVECIYIYTYVCVYISIGFRDSGLGFRFSREYLNMLYGDYVGIIFPFSY